MRLLKAYLNDSSHFVVIILRAAFATRAELNHFVKLVLSLSLDNRCRIMKVSQRVRWTRISDLGIIREATRNWRS